MIRILKSNDAEIEARQASRVRKQIELLTEDLQLIELKLEKTPRKNHR